MHRASLVLGLSPLCALASWPGRRVANKVRAVGAQGGWVWTPAKASETPATGRCGQAPRHPLLSQQTVMPHCSAGLGRSRRGTGCAHPGPLCLGALSSMSLGSLHGDGPRAEVGSERVHPSKAVHPPRAHTPPVAYGESGPSRAHRSLLTNRLPLVTILLNLPPRLLSTPSACSWPRPPSPGPGPLPAAYPSLPPSPSLLSPGPHAAPLSLFPCLAPRQAPLSCLSLPHTPGFGNSNSRSTTVSPLGGMVHQTRRQTPARRPH